MSSRQLFSGKPPATWLENNWNTWVYKESAFAHARRVSTGVWWNDDYTMSQIRQLRLRDAFARETDYWGADQSTVLYREVPDDIQRAFFMIFNTGDIAAAYAYAKLANELRGEVEWKLVSITSGGKRSVNV